MRYFLLAVTILTVGVIAANAEITKTITFDSEGVFSRLEDFDVIKVPGADLTAIPGNPQLPIVTKYFLIPENASVTSIEIIHTQEAFLLGTFDIFPVQKPSITKTPFAAFEPEPWIGQNPLVYENTSPYPARCIELGSQGNLSGYRIMSVNFYPYQYLPVQGRIKRIQEVTFRINYKTKVSENRVKRISEPSRKALKSIVSSLCGDQELLYDPFEDISRDSTIDYVIITPSTFTSSFQPLCDWKTQKGIRAHIVTTDSIYGNCPGSDDQEKIRNFIIDAHSNWGTMWVLLGGDVNRVPARIAYAMTCEAYYQIDEDSIRADLYYSDLDGNWNFDGMGPYGEVEDSVDLYPDVFVGRAPSSTPIQAQGFVNKMLTYEMNPPTDYELDMLFLAMVLWPDPFTDGALAKEQIDSLFVPERFNITKLYETWGNLNWGNTISALNAGQNLANHNGHAWYYIMSIGNDHLSNSDMDDLVNGTRQGILYSIGCWAAAFDYDCIAEHFVNNANGGGIAFIGNSRYGWGSPGNPKFGYSDRFDATFYDMLLCQGLHHLGAALAIDKASYISRSRQENVYRWHQYQLNLLGEPEVPVWTNTPVTLSVAHPETLQNGLEATIVVRDGSNLPVKDALICIQNGTSLYERGYTNEAGAFSTTISMAAPGMATITVTAQNFLPFIDSVYTKTTGPYLAYKDHSIDDNAGNDDGLLNPGESVYAYITMENYGTQNITDPTVYLRTSDSHVSLLDSIFSYTGTVQPQSTILCTLSFSVSAACENGDVAGFSIFATASQGDWTSYMNELIAKPYLHIACDSLHEDNGNGIIEPGETCDLYYSLLNPGYGYGYSVACNFSIPDPYLSISNGGSPSWPIVPPHGSVTGVLTFDISASCPDPHHASIDYNIATTEGYAFPGSLIVAVGHYGFSDDMESGTSKWTHAGSPDNWHLSSYRKHSGTYSWYCGIEGTHQYVSNSNDSLWTTPFHIGPNTKLSFWQWYEFTNYGTDGLYVIIKRQYQSDTLDFIGSGGALDSTYNIWNDWFREEYDLSYIPVGEEVRLCLSFIADDEDIAEGIYVDDVNIEGEHIAGKKEVKLVKPAIFNLTVYPSPMQHSTNVMLTIPQDANVKLTVYDLCGRRVRRLIDGTMQSGNHLIQWNGNSDNNKRLPQGIYFMRMEVPAYGFAQNRKIVLVR
jgi:hypothetical protein